MIRKYPAEKFIAANLLQFGLEVGRSLSHQPLTFLSQTYTSDIDHTGVLSEAIVQLPEAVPPNGTLELEIGYEGVIPLDTTRLTGIGVPAEEAKHTRLGPDQRGLHSRARRGVRRVGTPSRLKRPQAYRRPMLCLTPWNDGRRLAG